MGALSFHKSLDRKPGNDAPLRVRTLVEQARHVIEGDPDVAIPEIMQVGGSAGGARAKALILWNRDTDIIKSGFATEEPGDEHWLIKFDGVTTDSGGVGMKGTDEGQPWGRIEWCYAQMAREAGITMAETHLLRDADLAHFMTRRFDRESAPHPHMHSLAGMQHVDFNEQYQVAYETYFDTIRLLEIGQEAINQAFRRMVFSVSTINFDDHPKNFAFLMSRDGRWEISPAYDVAYAEGKAWTRQHQMSMNGKFSNITRADLRQIADNFDIPVHGKEIVDEVIESLDSWRRHAAEAGVPAEMIDYLEQRFERLP
jgi:serine/threonine-protein kinase HipA